MRVLIVVATALLLAGCAGGSATSPSGSASDSTTNANVAPPQIPLPGSFTSPDNITLTMGAPTAAELNRTYDPPPASNKFFVVTLETKNGSATPYMAYQPISAATSEADCKTAFDSAAGIEGGPKTDMLPGEARTWKAAFSCPAKPGTPIRIQTWVGQPGSNKTYTRVLFTGTFP